MKELVEVITKALVDDPEGVVVTEKVEGKTIIVEVRVADSDMGKVIGKQGRIAKAIGQDKNTTEKIIRNMMLKYNARDRGIKILELDGAFQMCTKQEYYEYLVEIALQPKKAVLTDVMLETLSIIAYKQPVTKQEIEAIRGVKCDHPINKLLEYRLIKEAGRLDAIGRPILFRTTEEFLRCFGVKSTDDLPVVGEEQVEDFKIQAQEEVKYTLDEADQEEEMEEM